MPLTLAILIGLIENIRPRLITYFDDEQFTRRMLRILLSLQHNMAGLNRKSTAELHTYYMKLIALLADECAEWLKTIDQHTSLS